MKKIIFLIILFLIYTIIINFYPMITQWDRNVIILVQDLLKDIPVYIPVLLGKELYITFIFLPLIIGFIFFFRELLIIDIILFSSAPFVAYIINSIIKIIIQRPRPPYELQIASHPDSYSYASNHTITTSVLWGLVIFYLIKYCKNKYIKIIGISFSFFWMFVVGFSRIWLGVHNPTDVIGGYILGGIFLFIYIKIINLIGGKV